LGRPPKLTVQQRPAALARLAAGETQADVERSYNVDATTMVPSKPDLILESGINSCGVENEFDKSQRELLKADSPAF
jgi:hypothetical protein